MARTIQQIRTLIDDQIKAEPALYNPGDPDAEGYINPDASNSLTAIWQGFKNVVARAIQTLELLWDIYIQELDKRAAEAIPGNERWYADRSLEFQYGDPLIVVDGKLTYATIDESKRIVKYVAVPPTNGIVVIKVAKDSAGEFVKLDPTTELLAFRAYINELKFAGTKTQIVSTDADLVWLQMKVYYSGLLLLDDVKTAVEAAINGYLKGIYFNGKFNVNLLRDAIEKAAGVNAGGVDIQSVQIKPSTGSFASVTLDYTPVSGYYKIDPAHPINNSAQITYLPTGV